VASSSQTPERPARNALALSATCFSTEFQKLDNKHKRVVNMACKSMDAEGPFAQGKVIHQRLDFSGCQHVWGASAFCALTDKPHRVAVKEFIAAGMIEEDGQDAWYLGARGSSDG
jgi:hypothetical protein